VRHRKGGRQLNRPTHERKALYGSLMGALLLHERITTTEAKAKAVRPLVERLITLARVSPDATPIERVHHLRQALAKLPNPDAVDHLFKEIGPRMASRPGGYTRIIKLGPRHGDAAPMAILELVDRGGGS
jgi:large subunit ribosomal protein L17